MSESFSDTVADFSNDPAALAQYYQENGWPVPPDTLNQLVQLKETGYQIPTSLLSLLPSPPPAAPAPPSAPPPAAPAPPSAPAPSPAPPGGMPQPLGTPTPVGGSNLTSAPLSQLPGTLGGDATGGAITAGNAVNSQLPGYAQTLGNIGANLLSESAGQLPADVIQQLQQQGAEAGTATGTNTNADYLKALGLTSLNLTNQAESGLESILPSLPGQAISQNPNFYETYGQQQQGQEFATNLATEQANQQAALAQAQAGLLAGEGPATTGVGVNYAPIVGGAGVAGGGGFGSDMPTDTDFMNQPWADAQGSVILGGTGNNSTFYTPANTGDPLGFSGGDMGFSTGDTGYSPDSTTVGDYYGGLGGDDETLTDYYGGL